MCCENALLRAQCLTKTDSQQRISALYNAFFAQNDVQSVVGGYWWLYRFGVEYASKVFINIGQCLVKYKQTYSGLVCCTESVVLFTGQKLVHYRRARI